jgi:hypothetical protein
MIPPRIPPMSTPQVKTRPCRPGDRLWLASVPCGACATIVVADPHPHPASGEANPPPIALTLTVMVPIKDGDIYIITPARSTVHTALGEPLVRDWGTGFADGRYRCKTTGVAGSNVAEIREHLISIGTEALQAVQGVVDAHGASVALWQSEQAAAYAAWPVQDTGEA